MLKQVLKHFDIRFSMKNAGGGWHDPSAWLSVAGESYLPLATDPEPLHEASPS